MKKKLKVRVPTKQSEMTLGQYQTWIDVVKQIDDGGSFLIQQQTVSIFCDVDIKFVKTMYHRTVKQIYNSIMDIINQKAMPMELKFKHHGVDWGFHTNFSSMTSGEYVDLQTYLAETNTLHKAMAILFRPITLEKYNKYLKVDQYLIEDYESSDKYARYMYDLPLDKALSVLFFLTDSQRILGNDLADYLKEELRSNPDLKNNLPKNMDGTTVSWALEKSLDILIPK